MGQTAPAFTEKTGSDNIFALSGLDTARNNAKPACYDFDADGDMDCVVGTDGGFLDYADNTGTAAAATLTWYTGTNSEIGLQNTVDQVLEQTNPFWGIVISSTYSAPSCFDADVN